MNSNAPGQLAGYLLQLPRAMYYLLSADIGDAVSVETVGDVSVTRLDGATLSEEDKSSLSSNPLTDKSVNLWKTFHNWIQQVENGDLLIEKTRFILFCNKAGRPALVDRFSSAENHEEIQKIISEIKLNFSDLKKSHPIWQHFEICIYKKTEIFSSIVERFTLETGSSTGWQEARGELLKKAIPEEFTDFALQELHGWLMEQVQTNILSRIPSIICEEDFRKKCQSTFSRVRTRELINFAAKLTASSKEIETHMKERSTYIKQLEEIDCSEDDIIEAINDYLDADVNLTKWLDVGIIDVQTSTEFEEKLHRFWKSKAREIQIAEGSKSDEEKGRLLLARCQQRQETVGGRHPPGTTVIGTYHALADTPSLGWHPHWETKFIKK